MTSTKAGQKHWWLYVLKLENEKWYVGITTQTPEKRYEQHRKGFTAARWTRKYRPVSLADTKDLGVCDIDRAYLFEGRVTREYMEKYGDNNVRGGDLTDIEPYTRHFGRIFLRSEWQYLSFVAFLLFVILLLLVDRL